MKQVLQDLKSGAVVVVETPDPAPARGRLLVRVQASLLSAGTESAQVAKSRQSLLERVRGKPELLRKGLQELRDGGLAGLRAKIAEKYEGYSELGYSCAGVVLHSGEDTGSIEPGTLVACGGVGIANHAELVSVPMLLSAIAPSGVTAEAAAYTTVGAIAMQGVRQAQAQLGEYVAVIGLGLVGLLTVQLLRAAGCRVVGIDPSEAARRRGVACGCEVVAGPEQASEAVLTLSAGMGADAVIICAATSSSNPVELAGKIARSRGRVTMVGATGMTLPREEYFAKELSFNLSRSYGPGRYDLSYELGGLDYPVDYVRFTEQRNMRAFLELLAQDRINTEILTTHRFSVDEAPAAFELLNNRSVERVGVVLQYSAQAAAAPRFRLDLCAPAPETPGRLGLGFIGAGAYAQGMLLPLLRERNDVVLRSVMNRSGSHALHASQRFGFESVCTRVEEVLQDPQVRVVFVTTRHDSHASLACQALRAGKHVWVEKPLSLTLPELKDVVDALRANPSLRLVVGFNRPHSRSGAWLKKKISGPAPLMMHYRVNAGHIPPNSWVHDPASGGGRLLGEGCHFLDFMCSMAGSPADSVQVEALRSDRSDLQATGNYAATVQFTNGSIGQLLYSSEGALPMGKEYFECLGGGASGILDDYRRAEFFSGNLKETLPRHPQDKGQGALLDAFLRGLQPGGKPLGPEQWLESSLLTLAAQESLFTGGPVRIEDLRRELL